MNSPVTRRALLGATAAAGVVTLPAWASPAATNHLDAALFDLLARHPAAIALTDACGAACKAPLALFHAAHPERPVALNFRFGDYDHDLGRAHGRERSPDGRVRDFYDVSDVNRLADAAPVTRWAPCNGDEPAWREPDLEGEARRHEILDAAERWQADRGALSEAVGLRAANEACDDALMAEVEIEDAIAATVPVTLDGFRAKAAWVVARPSEEAGERALDLLRALADIGGAAS